MLRVTQITPASRSRWLPAAAELYLPKGRRRRFFLAPLPNSRMLWHTLIHFASHCSCTRPVRQPAASRFLSNPPSCALPPAQSHAPPSPPWPQVRLPALAGAATPPIAKGATAAAISAAAGAAAVAPRKPDALTPPPQRGVVRPSQQPVQPEPGSALQSPTVTHPGQAAEPSAVSSAQPGRVSSLASDSDSDDEGGGVTPRARASSVPVRHSMDRGGGIHLSTRAHLSLTSQHRPTRCSMGITSGATSDDALHTGCAAETPREDS
jgi:hypothetical protein